MISLGQRPQTPSNFSGFRGNAPKRESSEQENKGQPHLPDYEQVGKTNSVRAANLSLVPRPREKAEVVAPQDFGELSRAVPRSRNWLIGGENRGLYLCGYRDHLHRRHGQLRSERIDLVEVPAA
jgi:hypothetical protein